MCSSGKNSSPQKRLMGVVAPVHPRNINFMDLLEHARLDSGHGDYSDMISAWSIKHICTSPAACLQEIRENHYSVR